MRDSEGKIVRDPETGEARRIDFVVVKDGQVVDSIEVTSETADKTGQTAKEERIRFQHDHGMISVVDPQHITDTDIVVTLIFPGRQAAECRVTEHARKRSASVSIHMLAAPEIIPVVCP